MRYNPTIPSSWSKDLAYLFGLLLGDGSLPSTSSQRPNGQVQKRYLIYFISNDKEFLLKVYIPLFERVFSITPRIETRIREGRIIYNCRIESQKAFEFLVDKGYISGRKARIAKIPKSLPSKYRFFLLAGLLDTDGGKKGNGFGLSTASEKLADFCIEMFKKANLPYHSCPWHYNGHVYHQIYVGKKNMHKILDSVPLKNLNKVNYLKSNMPL